MIWLVFILLVVCVGVVFFTKLEGHFTAADPVAHFKAQLREIDEDEERGGIEPEQAQAARLELKRRILRTATPAATPKASDTTATLRTRQSLLIMSCLFLLGGGFGLYGLLGSPNVPALKIHPVADLSNRPIEEDGITYGEAITDIEAHLSQNPENTEGWSILGRTANAVRDHARAVRAYNILTRLEPDEPRWRIEEFEAYMAHSNGQITPAARLVLSGLLSEYPEHPAGQYYLGLTRLQSGDVDGAKAIWTALKDRSAPNAPWLPALEAQLGKLGVQPPKLTDSDITAVENMSEEDRMIFIESMLERLTARLESNPDDPQGWMMLARSHLALGDKKAAITTLERGIRSLSGNKTVELRAFLDNLTSTPDL